MKVYGSAMAGGSFNHQPVPYPTTPLQRDGSDIASRVAAKQARTSPLGNLPTKEQIREAEVRAQQQPDINRGRRLLDRDEIARLYQSGWTVREICARLGCTPTPVYLALESRGIPRTGGKK